MATVFHMAAKVNFLKDVGYIFLNFPKTSQGENNGSITANYTQASIASTLCSKHFSGEQYERDPLQLAVWI